MIPVPSPLATAVTSAPEQRHQARAAVVDLGSNSVRLVVFAGRGRNPVAIFNEKAVLRLGHGLQETGRLNPEAVAQATLVLRRYAAIAQAMRADPFEVLATAAVRDAENGPAFIANLHELLPQVRVRVLAGAEEAALAAAGLVCGIPGADGILADIGGGSLETVHLRAGQMDGASTHALGVIRLAERAGGEVARARGIVEAELAATPWLAQGVGRDLFLVGGAWRALARIHIAASRYPLAMVHHYTIERAAARQLARSIAQMSRRTLERLTGAPRRRLEDLPFAAVVLAQLLRRTGARRVVFSANGLREGWYLQQLPAAERERDPLIACGHDYARRFSRDLRFPAALLAWTAPLFATAPAEFRPLRELACWMSEVGVHEHPEYRAEQAFLHVLRQPGVCLDHHARAFLGLTLALRYEAEVEAPFLTTALAMLSAEARRQAVILGTAMRLAYVLSAGTPELLAATSLSVGDVLTLKLAQGDGVFAGESITRRLQRLGAALGLAVATVVV